MAFAKDSPKILLVDELKKKMGPNSFGWPL